MAAVRFPDGTAVDTVGIGERRPDKIDRDHGFHVGANWRPTGSGGGEVAGQAVAERTHRAEAGGLAVLPRVLHGCACVEAGRAFAHASPRHAGPGGPPCDS
jgi:hypothetical protein